MRRLVKDADVVITDAGWSQHPQLQPEALRSLNPNLVYLSISEFGEEGPLANRPPYGELSAQLASEATMSLGVVGQPQELLQGVIDAGVRDLTIVSNNAGHGSPALPKLFELGRVRKLIASFPRPAPSAFEDLYRAGKIELELVPQGTIAERIRAAASGIPAFYTPTSAGTMILQIPAGAERSAGTAQDQDGHGIVRLRGFQCMLGLKNSRIFCQSNFLCICQFVWNRQEQFWHDKIASRASHNLIECCLRNFIIAYRLNVPMHVLIQVLIQELA